MTRCVLVLTSFAVALSLLPLGAAQPLPVPGPAPGAGCRSECRPSDINGGQIKTGDDPVKVILFAHYVENANEIAPVNTQELDKEPQLVSAPFTPTVIVPPANIRLGEMNALGDSMGVWFHMQSSPGLVYTDCSDPENCGRSHQESGLADPVHLSEEGMTLYWYLSTHAVPSQNAMTGTGSQARVGVMPNVGVYARLATGHTPFQPNAEVIAEGDTGAGDTLPILGAGAGRVNMVTLPSGDVLYEIAVPMRATGTSKVIPSDKEGFVLSVRVYQIKPKDAPLTGSEVMQEDWRVHLGPATPSRLVMNVMHPMTTKLAQVYYLQKLLWIKWAFLSPFGSYDAKALPEDISISIDGPTKVDPGLVKLQRIKVGVEHGDHFNPVNVTWTFDYQKAALADGTYTITMKGRTLQDTYELVQTVTFTMTGGKPGDITVYGAIPDKEKKGGLALPGGKSPAVDPALFGVALAALLVVLVRRRRF